MSESIVCRTCAAAMATERCERGREATTCWHVCPVCGERRMTSEPGVYEARGARRSALDGGRRRSAAPSREDEERY